MWLSSIWALVTGLTGSVVLLLIGFERKVPSNDEIEKTNEGKKGYMRNVLLWQAQNDDYVKRRLKVIYEEDSLPNSSMSKSTISTESPAVGNTMISENQRILN